MSPLGTKRTYRTVSHLPAFGGKADMAHRCSADGGGVDVVPRTRDATMHLDLISGPACDEDSGQELTGGNDDRVFRLDRVNDAACAGMQPR
jgi:hypothetical protein